MDFRNSLKSITGGQKTCKSTNHPPSISEYSLYEKLGEGTYGRVRLVQCRKNRRWYALKYIPKSEPPAKLKSFIREREALSRLKHPLICNLSYAFQDSQYLYLTLDYMSGGDLSQYLQRYTFSEGAIRTIIAEITCALDYIHSQGYVHRDVKPENILLDEYGHSHLCDFNIATKLTAEAPTVRAVSGTFFYQAPEIHERLPYTGMADWWALGCVFYECIYGRVPFRARTSPGMVKAAASGLKFRQTEPPVDKRCTAAIEGFLRYAPHQRVRDAKQVFEYTWFGNTTVSEWERSSHFINPDLVLWRAPRPQCISESREDTRLFLETEALQWKGVARPSASVQVNSDAVVSSGEPRKRYSDKLKFYGEMINQRLRKFTPKIGDSTAELVGRKQGSSAKLDDSPPRQEYESSKAQANISTKQTAVDGLGVLLADFQFNGEDWTDGDQASSGDSFKSGPTRTSRTSSTATSIYSDDNGGGLPRGIVARGRAGKGSRFVVEEDHHCIENP